jgi:spore maturation protein CgeB
MRHHLRELLNDGALARRVAEHGRRTILERHTCAHRVDELLRIHDEIAS